MTQWSQSLSLESRKIGASEGVTTVGEHTYHSGTREKVTRLEARVEEIESSLEISDDLGARMDAP